MFLKELFLFTVVVGLATAKVPSYIQVCGARNPKFDECVLKSVSALTPKLREGIPELEIPPLDPLLIDRVQLADLPNFKAIGTNIRLSGLETYHVNFLHVDLAKQQVDIEVKFDEIKLNALYNVSARILVPIAGMGPIKLNTKDVSANIKMNWKLVERGNKKYLYFPTLTLRLNVKDYTVDFETQNFDKTLREAVTQALGSSHQEVLDVSRPNLEKAISERILDMSNKICKHFTYDELFPDRE